MKLRLLLMGSIISVLAVVLGFVRGFHPRSFVLLAVGIVLFVAGLLWPSRRAATGRPPQ